MSASYGDVRTLLSGRVLLFELFHRLLGGKPNAEFARTAAAVGESGAVELFADEGSPLAGFAGMLASLSDDDAAVQEMADAYGRFLIGPGRLKALPWESPYVEKEPVLFQESTLDVRQRYAVWGLQAVKLRAVPDDHVALMCDFLAQLGRRAVVALDEGTLDEADRLIAASYSFEQDHLLPWLPEYAAMAADAARTGIYPRAVAALAEFVAVDANVLANTVLWISQQREVAQASGEVRAFEVEEGARAENRQYEELDESLRAFDLFGLDDNTLGSASAS